MLQGVAEVTEGRSFCLSLPLDRPGRGLNPARHPPRRFATIRHQGMPTHNFPMSVVISPYTVATGVVGEPTAPGRRSSPLKKASLTGFHATAKHIAAKAVSPSSETMRTI